MFWRKSIRYCDNIQYLAPSIFYLGTNSDWWARSPSALAMELSLDEKGLLLVFEGFSEIFRKSKRVDKATGQHFFALQARYAKRDGSDLGETERSIDVPPLPIDHLKLILDFVLHMSEAERSSRRNLITNVVAVAAAIVAATAAVVAAAV